MALSDSKLEDALGLLQTTERTQVALKLLARLMMSTSTTPKPYEETTEQILKGLRKLYRRPALIRTFVDDRWGPLNEQGDKDVLELLEDHWSLHSVLGQPTLLHYILANHDQRHLLRQEPKYVVKALDAIATINGMVPDWKHQNDKGKPQEHQSFNVTELILAPKSMYNADLDDCVDMVVDRVSPKNKRSLFALRNKNADHIGALPKTLSKGEALDLVEKVVRHIQDTKSLNGQHAFLLKLWEYEIETPAPPYAAPRLCRMANSDAGGVNPAEVLLQLMETDTRIGEVEGELRATSDKHESLKSEHLQLTRRQDASVANSDAGGVNPAEVLLQLMETDTRIGEVEGELRATSDKHESLKSEHLQLTRRQDALKRGKSLSKIAQVAEARADRIRAERKQHPHYSLRKENSRLRKERKKERKRRKRDRRKSARAKRVAAITAQ